MKEFVDEFAVDGFVHISDQSAQLWNTFEISAQPAYVFINDNGEISRQIGALPDDVFDNALQQLIDT